MEMERQVADDVADAPAGRATKVLIVDDSAIHRERLVANLAMEWAGSAIGADTFTVNG
jgi:hypothetical protein